MHLLIGVLLFSWLLHTLLYIPYIQILYTLRMQRLKQVTRDAFNKRTPLFDKFHQHKAGTPVGGGLLIIVFTSILLPIVLFLMYYFWLPITSVYPLHNEIKIILFTFISFGMLGFLDDIKKTFAWAKHDFFGLRLRHKLILEVILATIVGYWMITDLKIDIFHVPIFGVLHMGWWYLPFATFIIIAFANAFNITDGLDGLSGGVLAISLFAFWLLSASILDTVLATFIALWIGGVLAFLYFNVNPSRIFLGDVGALSFGATYAVVGLLLGKVPALMMIGGIFILEVSSSFIQLTSKSILKRKVFVAAPLHLWLQAKGWSEPKIVMRFWIVSIVFALIGLWLAFVA
jgi:phospho-N-acetylmuramoyl-pentapeptide-transferase